MKKIYLLMILFILPLLLISCTKTVSPEKLVDKNNIIYEAGSDEPYTGKVIKYFSDNDKNIAEEYSYNNGRLDGNCYTYWKNGKKGSERTYKNDQFVDKLIAYNEDGSIAYSVDFNSGKEYPSINMVMNDGTGQKYFLTKSYISYDQLYKAIRGGESAILSAFGEPTSQSRNGANISISYNFYTYKMDKRPQVSVAKVLFELLDGKPKSLIITYSTDDKEVLPQIKSLMSSELNSIGFSNKAKEIDSGSNYGLSIKSNYYTDFSTVGGSELVKQIEIEFTGNQYKLSYVQNKFQ